MIIGKRFTGGNDRKRRRPSHQRCLRRRWWTAADSDSANWKLPRFHCLPFSTHASSMHRKTRNYYTEQLDFQIRTRDFPAQNVWNGGGEREGKGLNFEIWKIIAEFDTASRIIHTCTRLATSVILKYTGSLWINFFLISMCGDPRIERLRLLNFN